MRKLATLGVIALSAVLLAGCTAPEEQENEVAKISWNAAADELFSYAQLFNKAAGTSGMGSEATLVKVTDSVAGSSCEKGDSYWKSTWIFSSAANDVTLEELEESFSSVEDSFVTLQRGNSPLIYGESGVTLIVTPGTEETSMRVLGKSACFSASDAPEKLTQLADGTWEEVGV